MAAEGPGVPPPSEPAKLEREVESERDKATERLRETVRKGERKRDGEIWRKAGR